MIVTGLSEQPIDVVALTERIHSPASGAVVSFEGTTRTTGNNGQTVTGLFYEAYERRAEAQLREFAQTALSRRPLQGIVAIHRTGYVPTGEPGVLVVVAAEHRAEAFEACQFLIDTIKHEAAIWKKEIYSDGSEAWAGLAAAR